MRVCIVVKCIYNKNKLEGKNTKIIIFLEEQKSIILYFFIIMVLQWG